MRVSERSALDLMEQANTYASRIYPPMVAGLVGWMLSNYHSEDRLTEVSSLASEVINHARAAGWHLTVDDNDFYVAVPPPEHVTPIVVRRESATWDLIIDGQEGAGSVRKDAIMAQAAEYAARAHQPITVTVDDQASPDKNWVRKYGHLRDTS
jgi:hypothetical protein